MHAVDSMDCGSGEKSHNERNRRETKDIEQNRFDEISFTSFADERRARHWDARGSRMRQMIENYYRRLLLLWLRFEIESIACGSSSGGGGGDEDDDDDGSGGVVFLSVDRDLSSGPILLTACHRLMHSFDLRVIMAAERRTIVHSGRQSVDRDEMWDDRENGKQKKKKKAQRIWMESSVTACSLARPLSDGIAHVNTQDNRASTQFLGQ